MTGVLFVPPQFVLVTNNGVPRSAAKAYFYRAGTSTDITVYQTSALADGASHTQPVVADSNGTFPAIYVDPAVGSYKVKFQTSAGVDVATYDNIPATSGWGRTAAEIAASVTPASYSYPPGDTRRYTNGIYDAILQAKQSGGEKIIQWYGTLAITSEIVIDGDGIVLDCHGVQLSTTSDIPMLRFGPNSTTNTINRDVGLRGSITITGAGTGKTNNHGIVIRNVSYGDFGGSVKITNCGGNALLVTAYQRGVQYNRIGAGWALEANWGTSLKIDPQGVGGYVNDCQFFGIRAFDHAAAGLTVAHLINSGFNRFYGCAFESGSTTDILLRIESGENNAFYGLRLDGVSTTTTLQLDANAIANWFLGYITDGTTIVDNAKRNFFLGDSGTLSFPLIRFGSYDATNAWEIKMHRPGSVDELYFGANHTGGIVRVPSTTNFAIGDREGGDSAPIEFYPSAKRLDLATLPSTAIGAGPSIRFDGRYSSSGNEGTATLQQDANGLVFSTSTAGDQLYLANGVLGLADGITAPAAVTGRAIIYVDAADGDLKVKFADGVTKVLAADT